MPQEEPKRRPRTRRAQTQDPPEAAPELVAVTVACAYDALGLRGVSRVSVPPQAGSNAVRASVLAGKAEPRPQPGLTLTSARRRAQERSPLCDPAIGSREHRQITRPSVSWGAPVPHVEALGARGPPIRQRAACGDAEILGVAPGGAA
jgi:hypothetical protein